MREPGISRRVLDRENLRQVLQLIGSRYPEAAVAVFETSDQNVGYGFFLMDVRDRGGLSLWGNTTDLQRDWMRDAAEPFLMDIDWDGVIGEDEHGVGEVATTL